MQVARGLVDDGRALYSGFGALMLRPCFHGHAKFARVHAWEFARTHHARSNVPDRGGAEDGSDGFQPIVRSLVGLAI
jgi:hypothetical protein